jgi:hypothetical protein
MMIGGSCFFPAICAVWLTGQWHAAKALLTIVSEPLAHQEHVQHSGLLRTKALSRRQSAAR